VALYRDGCKMSQPLSSTSKESAANDEISVKASLPPAARSSLPPLASIPPLQALGVASPPTLPTGTRVRLPKKRIGFTQEAKVGGHKIFLRTGQYVNGQLGEIFIDMHKEGAAFRSLMNCFAMSVSIGLQYGVPLETFVEQFTFTRFEPQGLVEGHPNIKFATSGSSASSTCTGTISHRCRPRRPSSEVETRTPAIPRRRPATTSSSVTTRRVCREGLSPRVPPSRTTRCVQAPKAQ
jgi:hypothetical protein